MKPSVLMLLAAASMPLAACASTSEPVASADTAPAEYQSAAAPAPQSCRSVGGTALTGAAVGGVGGAAVGAATGSLLTGAVIGAAVGGLAGAIWADANNDGCVDGYVREGRYYEGEPAVQPVSGAYRSGERG